jgi:outer membrane protein assembly factor BamA
MQEPTRETAWHYLRLFFASSQVRSKALLSWCVLAFFLFLFLWQSTFQVVKIDIQGLSRFQPEAVLTTVALKANSEVGKTDLDAVCQKLIVSGLFEGCNWKYAPTSSTGGTLTLDLKEAPAPQTVRLTIPGVSDEQLWSWLAQNEPLVQRKMPSSDEAAKFYTDAIRRYLKQDLASSVDTNLNTHETTIVFRPANLPSIQSIKFEGAQAIDAATLEKKLAPIAQGTPFTEYDLNHLLDLNIRPLYEETGRLNVKFSNIKAEGGAVTIHVDEGKVYKFGRVKATGVDAQPQLTAGDVAQWSKVQEALDAIGKTLRNEGYLEATYKVTRDLKEDGTVDINADYTRGNQSVFGKLKLSGLNPTQESMVRPLWTLAPGAPMNESYVDDFVKAAFTKLGPEFSGVASQTEPSGGNVVDVSITFRTR